MMTEHVLSDPDPAVSSPSTAHTNHRRTGKVARLPAAIREQVNQFIDDGMAYPHIIAWLTENGYPGFAPANLTNWRQGGFQDWLTHGQRLDELELKLQYATEFALKADPAKFHHAALNLTCLHFFETLNRFDTHDLSATLQARPDRYPTIINSLSRFTREMIALERHRAEKQENKASASAGGISPESVAKMLLALRIRYPEPFVVGSQNADPDPRDTPAGH